MPHFVTSPSKPAFTHLALHRSRSPLRGGSGGRSGGRAITGGLLWITPVHCQTTLAAEPAAADRALHSTTLLTYCLLSFTGALVACSVTLPAEAPPALWTLHLALRLGRTGLLLVALLQPLAARLTPAHPREGCLIPLLLWDSNSLQIPANQVSPSLLRSPWWAGLGQPTKQCLLWQSMFRHPSHMTKPLKSALCHLSCHRLCISPQLPCHLGGYVLFPLLPAGDA